MGWDFEVEFRGEEEGRGKSGSGNEWTGVHTGGWTGEVNARDDRRSASVRPRCSLRMLVYFVSIVGSPTSVRRFYFAPAAA